MSKLYNRDVHIAGGRKLLFDASASASTQSGERAIYVKSDDNLYYWDGTTETDLATSASATAFDDITDPDANNTIALAGYTHTYTSTLDNGTVWTISNTDADLAADTVLIDLKFTDDGDANGIFFRCLDNSGADAKFTVGANGATTIAGSAAGTDALTVTAGDVTMTSGHLVMTSGNLTMTAGNLSMVSGDLDLTDGSVKISKDNEMLTLGASDATDSYLKFDGTDLIFYDSNYGSETTLTQLQTVGADPTITGDVTISDGKLDWTNGTDEVAGTWSFAGTSNNDISWASSVTTGKCLSITADNITSGSMVYLDNTAAGFTGKYLQCFDGVADDFSVGANGLTTIAGSAAGTDALVVTVGDLFLSDTDGSVIESENGTATVLTVDNKGGAIADNSAVLLIDAGGTPAAAGSNLLRVNFTGTDTNKPMLVEVDGGGKDCSALSLDADPTVNDVALFHSDAVLAADKAILRLDHATGASAAGSALLRLTESATPNAGAYALEIDAQKDMVALYIDTDAVTNDACTVTHSGNLAAGKSVMLLTDAGIPADAAGSVLHAQFTGTATNKQRVLFVDGGGKDVTGLYIDADTATSSSSQGSVVMRSDDAGALGPTIVGHHNSASPAADDQLLAIYAYGEEGTSSDTMLYAQMTFECEDPTDDSINGMIKMGVADGSAGASNIRESFNLTDDAMWIGAGDATVSFGSNGAFDLEIGTNVTTAGLTAAEPSIVLTDGNAGNITLTAGTTSGEIDLASPHLTSLTTSAGTADGAITVYSSIVEMASDADGTALTLADGVEGQHLYLTFITDGGGDVVVTPANLAGGDTTLTFTDVGESAHLMFTNSTWVILGTHPDVAVA